MRRQIQSWVAESAIYGRLPPLSEKGETGAQWGKTATSVTVDRRVVSARASVAFTGPDAGARHGSEEERAVYSPLHDRTRPQVSLSLVHNLLRPRVPVVRRPLIAYPHARPKLSSITHALAMNSKLSLFTAVALALLATAAPHAECDSTTTQPAHTHTSPTKTWTPRTSTSTLTSTATATRTGRTYTRTTTATATVTDYPPTQTVTIVQTRTQTETRTTTETESDAYTATRTATITTVESAAPSATGSAPSGGAGQCNTGQIQCCDQVKDSKSPEMSSILSSLGIDLTDELGLAGTSCSPIDTLSLGGSVEW